MPSETDGIAQIVKNDGSHVGMAVVVDPLHVMTCAHVISQPGAPHDVEDQPPKEHEHFYIRFPFLPDQQAIGHVVKWGLTADSGEIDLVVLELSEPVPVGVSCAVFSVGVATGMQWKAYGQRQDETSPCWTTEQGSRISSRLGDGRVQLDGPGMAGRLIDYGYSGAAVWCEGLRASIGLVAAKHGEILENRISCMIPAESLSRFWPNLCKAPEGDVAVMASRGADGPTARHDVGTSTARMENQLERLAKEMYERKQLGVTFNLFLGSGCFTGSGTRSSLKVLREAADTDTLQGLLARLSDYSMTARLGRLGQALCGVPIPSGYMSLARLIAANWFTCILTSNVDGFLEDALIELHAGDLPLCTLVIGKTSTGVLLRALEGPSPMRKLVKIRGDLSCGVWLITPEEVVEHEHVVERVLKGVFRRDSIIVGHAFGDPPLERFIKLKGDSIWLVDLKGKVDEELLAKLRARGSDGNLIAGEGVSFEVFFRELEGRLVDLSAGDTGGGQREITEAQAQRRVRLVRLQSEMEQEERRLEAIMSSNSPAAAVSQIEDLEKLRQEVDALSHAGEGTILGGFKIGERIGCGGLGTVYRAKHIVNGLNAAVKVMARDHAQDSVWRARFFRGSRLMATLNHPNIVRILDVGGMIGPWCYYTMEFIDGPDLEVLLAAGTLRQNERWDIAQGILEAMAFVHTSGGLTPVVHRDLKPSNVLVDSHGQAKITDFDMAFLEETKILTRSSAMPMGIAFYLAPELELNPTLREERSPAVDVYALGRILLRLFTGIPPIERIAVTYQNTPDLLRFALISSVPGPAVAALARILGASMAPSPDERYRDAAELLEHFHRTRAMVEEPRVVCLDDSSCSMRRIESGHFEMGSDEGESGRESSELKHVVTISNPFLIGGTPVTRSLWAVVWGEESPPNNEGAKPIEEVSWYDAIGFCNAISLDAGLEPCYYMDEGRVIWDMKASGFRLPSEAEWEYACRAGTLTKYNLGNEEQDLSRAGWYTGNCVGGPMAVGMKEPNCWGIYDMHGNVWEWCWDWHSAYPAGAQTDPRGPSDGRNRVLRGGSHRRSAHHCRSATRYESPPNNRGKSLGFRLARNAE